MQARLTGLLTETGVGEDPRFRPKKVGPVDGTNGGPNEV